MIWAPILLLWGEISRDWLPCYAGTVWRSGLSTWSGAGKTNTTASILRSPVPGGFYGHASLIDKPAPLIDFSRSRRSSGRNFRSRRVRRIDSPPVVSAGRNKSSLLLIRLSWCLYQRCSEVSNTLSLCFDTRMMGGTNKQLLIGHQGWRGNVRECFLVTPASLPLHGWVC